MTPEVTRAERLAGRASPMPAGSPDCPQSRALSDWSQAATSQRLPCSAHRRAPGLYDPPSCHTYIANFVLLTSLGHAEGLLQDAL